MGGYLNQISKVQWVHGQCPVSPWTQWTLSMDIVQFVRTPWTLSRVSMDNVQTVHWVHGQCPLNPWPLSSLAGVTGLCPWTHWTLSRVSMDIVQTVHWVHGKSPLSPCTFYRRELSIHCPSSVCQHFQTSSPQKPLGQLKTNFICSLHRLGERKFLQTVVVTWPRWLPWPYMVKIFSWTNRLMTWKLNTGTQVLPNSFKIMILCLPLTFLWKGQI